MSNKIRVGVFGGGGAGHHHLEAFANMSEEVEIVGVAEINQTRGALLESEFSVTCYNSGDSLISAGLDLGVVALPHDQLLDCGLDLLNEGCHLLMEKPMGNSLAEARTLREAYNNATDLVCAVSFVHRYRPAFAKAANLLKNGELGDVVSIHEHFRFPGDSRVPKWVWRHESSGGGVLLYSGIHNLDRILWFIGSNAISVAGVVGIHSHDVDVEDGVGALIRFENGCYATVVGNQPSSVVPSTFARTEVYCREGTLIVSNGTELTVVSGDGEVSTQNFEPLGHFEQQARNVVSAILNSEPAFVTLEDGVEAYRIAEAVYESHRVNKTVNMNDV
jgi:predicted dehydrogenase